MDRKKLKKMFEDMKKAKIQFEDLKYKCLDYIEKETGTGDFNCVDAQTSPELYTFEQFLEKQGISERTLE